MSIPAPEALDRGSIPWLFAVALATTAPHFEHQPLWLSALVASYFCWGALLWWRGTRLPRYWMLVLCVVLGCIALVIEYRSLIGRDVGVSLVELMMSLKFLELRSRRDAYVIAILGYFLLLTHYLYSQGIVAGFWLFLCTLMVTATLVRMHGGIAVHRGYTLKLAGTMTAQAIPFMLVLYFLFPRVPGPLWGLPQDAFGGRTGLTDSMSPGSVSHLAKDASIAFRAQFDASPPRNKDLYWRGPVLEDYDGRTWTQSAFALANTPPTIRAQSPPLSYALTVEPHNQRWLVMLESPVSLPAGVSLTQAMIATTPRPLRQRQHFSGVSATQFTFNQNEGRYALQRNLRLPPGKNPRTSALAIEWRQSSPAPEVIIDRALNHFRQQNFRYTLSPPLLGPHPIDEFLFATRAGFCEHYAAAFVVLMRAAGLPARVVTGYQGGDLNPVDGYLVVRQSDAHAWSEVWLEGRGWTRVDPTAAISPDRIESGIASAIPEGEVLPGLIHTNWRWIRQFRYRWEAISNTWNQWILEYDTDRQRQFITSLGIEDANWQSLGILLTAICGTLLAFTAMATLRQRKSTDPALRLWQKSLQKLQRRGFAFGAWEAPGHIALRVRSELPQFAPQFTAIYQAYCATRYGGDQEALARLRKSVNSM